MGEENDAISSMRGFRGMAKRMWRFLLPYLRFLPFLRDKRKESLEDKMEFCCEFYTMLPLSSSSEDVKYSHTFSSLDIKKLLSTSRGILQRAQHRPSICTQLQMLHWRPFQLWEVSYFCLRQGVCSLTVCHIFFHFSMSV